MYERRSLLFMATAITLFLGHCASRKEVAYTRPSEAEMADIRGDFDEQFERGRILYNGNCGGCHNLKINGRMVVPDFSLPQLLDYEMRMQYAAHGDRLSEARVSKEELDDIQVYLRFRRPSGHPVAPLPVPQAPPKMN